VTRRAVILVLDGVGIGAAPDADQYGDVGSNTLGHVADHMGGLDLPAMAAAGLGNVVPLRGMPARPDATAAWGSMTPASRGKDSTTGHWEIAGVHLAEPFPTYPDGFPDEIIDAFARATDRPVIGNVVSSGTAVLDRYGDEHRRTGAWIVYTSADSVFQVAAHEEIVPLPELYAACEAARALLVAPHNVSRVIARPFLGEPGNYRRTANRRDLSIEPPAETLLDALAAAGVARHVVGKVDDLFAGRGIVAQHTTGNADGIARILEWVRGPNEGLLFANLVDFDQLYGGSICRSGSSTPRFRSFLPPSGRTTCCSSPPITATTPRPRPRTTRASGCLSWWPVPGSVRSIWGSGRLSRISGRRSVSGWA
jgi:phosphopentomutase